MADQKQQQKPKEKQSAKSEATPEQKQARLKEKQENFVRLAEARVPRVAKMIKLLGNLGNKGNYAYSPEQVKKITDYIDDAVRSFKNSFTADGQAADGFKF